MSLLVLFAVAFSSVFLLLLCGSDPKRQRAVGGQSKKRGPAVRPLLVIFTALPGAFYALTAAPAAFFIWLGGCAVIGWLSTLLFSARHNQA